MQKRRFLAAILALATVISPLSATAKESEDLENALAQAEGDLNTGRYCTDFQGNNAVLWDGYIADIQKSIAENGVNSSLQGRLNDLQAERRNITRYIAECAALLASAIPRVADIRARLAVALAAETAAAAAAAKAKALSEEEAKAAVVAAQTQADATKQRIQTDEYNANDAAQKIEVLNKTIESLDSSSSTYKQVQDAIAALRDIETASKARLAQNIELKKQQNELLATLKDIQSNNIKVNSAAATSAIESAISAQEKLASQKDELEKDALSLNERLVEIDLLLSRISKDSVDYAKLLSTKEALLAAINDVNSAKDAAIESAKKQEELAAQAKEAEQSAKVKEAAIAKEYELAQIKEETLPTRVENVLLGAIVGENDKQPIPVYKAKKLNSKYSVITTKVVRSKESDEIDLGSVDSEELDGVKVTLKGAKTSFKLSKVTLNENGTISMRLPSTLKSGTYTMSVDLPDTDVDVAIKVKIST